VVCELFADSIYELKSQYLRERRNRLIQWNNDLPAKEVDLFLSDAFCASTGDSQGIAEDRQ